MAVLVAADVCKTFGSVTAVADVSLDLQAAEIHAVVGENGAGKTTLMRMFDGLVVPDRGEIIIGGEQLGHGGPRAARSLGVGMVHQHFALVPTMTVTENMLLGSERRLLDLRQARRRLIEVAEENGLDISPGLRVGLLPIGLQQRVEILKMLYHGADTLILDEPTSVLAPPEIAELLQSLRRLRQQGKAILFVSHKLPEVLAIADRITVMRRGRTVAHLQSRDTNEAELARLMVGDLLPSAEQHRAAASEGVELEVTNLLVRPLGDGSGAIDVSLTVRAGEIVGVAAVAGNGQAELVRAVAGLLPSEHGRIVLCGQDVTRASVERRRKAGLAYVPQDRMQEGIAASASVADNLLLGLQREPRFRSHGLLRSRAIKAYAQDLVDRFDIRAPNLRTTAGTLSGGNIQKLIVARELAGTPRMVMVEEPTWGLDVYASAFIRQELVTLRNQGHAVLLVSSDLDEVLELADRVVVLYRGRVVGEVVPGDSSGDRLGALMAGAA